MRFRVLLLVVFCAHSSLGSFEIDLDASELSQGASLQFVHLFSKCVRFTPRFDECVKSALNSAQYFYATGVPGLNLPAIDPLLLNDVKLAKTSYELKMTNIKDFSWKESTINRFKSSHRRGGYVKLDQFCPEFFIEGRYRVLNRNLDADDFQEGTWNLTLFDMHRTIFITPNKEKANSFRVKLSITDISDVQINISDSNAEDDSEKEYLENQFLASFWMFGFPMARPYVEELLASAYSEKISQIFGHFDWSLLFPHSATVRGVPGSR